MTIEQADPGGVSWTTLIPFPGGSPSTQPYPTSNYVTVSSVDPTVTSIGDTQAGDNWASTWADDDAVYTYFDDGTGFGFSSARSMSPAKILGNPAHGSEEQNKQVGKKTEEVAGNLIVFDLRKLTRFREESPFVQILLDSGAARMVLFAFKAGQHLVISL